MSIADKTAQLLDELSLFQDWTERYEYVIGLGKQLPPIEESSRTDDHLIKGCQSQVRAEDLKPLLKGQKLERRNVYCDHNGQEERSEVGRQIPVSECREVNARASPRECRDTKTDRHEHERCRDDKG